MKLNLLLLCLASLIAAVPAQEGSPAPTAVPAPMTAPDGPNIVAGQAAAPHRGIYELSLVAEAPVADPYFDPALTVTFTRPDASTVTVDGFYDGVADGRPVFKARAYCDLPGPWTWTAASKLPSLDGRTGAFTVAPSTLPGKLRKHPEDPRQFAYDNGTWFLHIGDTGYRYVADTEPEWQAYIDQAAQMGATKIRVWFCRGRSDVQALFNGDRTTLDLAYWQEIDRRMQYALNRHPAVIFQLIPYGEDAKELRRYGKDDRMSWLVAAYAQARLSAFPNVTWCVSNDMRMVGDDVPLEDTRVPASVIDRIARDMAAREPWGTLLTNHQARQTGYAFTTAPWSDIVTLEDIDQVHGSLLLEYRDQTDDPVVLDEDRYELYRPPAHVRYFFRRMMWASLLSGGNASYGGAQTYIAYNGRDCGVRGYYDLKKEGILNGGADDFVHIHAFFKDAGLTLTGMQPADAIAGNDPHTAKAIAGARTVIVYLPNADAKEPGKADAAATPATGRLQLPAGAWALRWFNPQTGEWHDDPATPAAGGETPREYTAPFPGDAVLLARLGG